MVKSQGADRTKRPKRPDKKIIIDPSEDFWASAQHIVGELSVAAIMRWLERLEDQQKVSDDDARRLLIGNEIQVVQSAWRIKTASKDPRILAGR
jgi:predicted DNA-binding ArsR family transcriptional regulator